MKDDKEMHLLKESIEKYGILNPLIVRPVQMESMRLYPVTEENMQLSYWGIEKYR